MRQMKKIPMNCADNVPVQSPAEGIEERGERRQETQRRHDHRPRQVRLHVRVRNPMSC